MARFVELICETCESRFSRRATEAKRNARMGRRTFCSLRCAGKESVDHLKKYSGQNAELLQADNRRDGYTGFRTHLHRAYRRKHDVDLTLDDLVAQWEKQSGRCVYTGVQLQHPSPHGENDAIYTASLDRIDSKKGYVRGNVQFVSMSANFAKARMTHEQMLEFCRVIRSHDVQ